MKNWVATYIPDMKFDNYSNFIVGYFKEPGPYQFEPVFFIENEMDKPENDRIWYPFYVPFEDDKNWIVKIV